MTEKIILSVFAISMLIWNFKKGDKLTNFLTAGLTVGILITWSSIPIIITAGLIIYMLTSLLISITNYKNKKLTKFNQVTIILAGIFAFSANLFSIMHWPYSGVVRISMIIPIILYLVSLLNGMLKRPEMRYMTILNVEFVLKLIR